MNVQQIMVDVVLMQFVQIQLEVMNVIANQDFLEMVLIVLVIVLEFFFLKKKIDIQINRH